MFKHLVAELHDLPKGIAGQQLYRRLGRLTERVTIHGDLCPSADEFVQSLGENTLNGPT